MERSTTDTAALMLVGVVGFFVVASMVAIVVMAFAGVGAGENIWAGLFSLATAILGALAGYLGGQAVTTRKRNGNGA